MSDVDVTLRLPETLVEKARAQGLLNDERIARLLTAEIERVETWHGLDQALEPTRKAFRADHPEMSEDDAAAMLSDIIDEVRADDRAGTRTRQDAQ